jgi:anaerobic ribonucleoside-triphosphate reductase
MKFASETTKPFVDDYLLSERVKTAVRDSYIHIHDKDYYPTKSLTCVQHPLDKILKNGFFAGHGESRPAKRIETASILGCISLETAQNEMHGGQAIPAFDFYLAPFVRNSFIEEIKVISDMNGVDYSHLYQVDLDDYITRSLDGLTGDARVVQHAVNRTVSRVHQSMEAFIHNMNTIHSRGGNQVVFSLITEPILRPKGVASFVNCWDLRMKV